MSNVQISKCTNLICKCEINKIRTVKKVGKRYSVCDLCSERKFVTDMKNKL